MAQDRLDGINPCHEHACDLQECLNKYPTQHDKCQNILVDLYRCCNKFYATKGTSAQVDACPIPTATKKKLESLGQKVDFKA
ncbi:hypothetical protein BDZ90DRAFT_262149 [Jaminaea rosea]|uniref:Cx9C motif-containing protein 4, mitochondrial n=1 Tax=Jaminaea rosea TaxID=1569628 RepID=A0A316UJV2_9BASI|nr:hypothetical protein BDZ90DRAFT_262149 [Jaminaea rosea]PWN25500.1 hypothetical protein BDZ90DRAFT_262149 [Jaminaea rosea]